MAKRSELLKNMKVPPRPAAEQEADMDLEMLEDEMPEEEMMEGPDTTSTEIGNPATDEVEEMSPLEDISDEDLLAELKKRGLAPEEEEEMEDEEAEYEDELA